MTTIELTEKERKSLRQKARRNRRRGEGGLQKSNDLMVQLYKPIEEWDEEELARGRPRAKDGTFKGKLGEGFSLSVREEALDRFVDLIRGDMRTLTPKALKLVEWALTCEDVDERGKRVVPPSTALDAAKWVVEHLIGKPTQRIEEEISIKLQAVLGAAMVNPSGGPAIEATSTLSEKTKRRGAADQGGADQDD